MTKRRALIGVAAAAALILLAAAPPAQAQFRERRRPVSLAVDIGYMNINSHPRWLTLGAELELRLGRVFSLNPEISFWLRDAPNAGLQVVPGGTANLRLGRFFIGGGAVRRISDWSEQAGGTFVPKAQAGLVLGPARFSAVMLFLNRTDTFVLGLVFSFRI